MVLQQTHQQTSGSADALYVASQSFVPQQQQSQRNHQDPSLRGMGLMWSPPQPSSPPNIELINRCNSCRLPLSFYGLSDEFHVAPKPFVPQQQQSQRNHQDPSLRGMGPTGSPPQPSSPPNIDLINRDVFCRLPSSFYGLADGFHVGPQPFVPQQQQSQGNNQGSSLRGMGPMRPSTQASMPPNTDLNVQQLPQASINLAYVNQSQVRGATPTNYPRPLPQPSQTPRISGSHRQAQPIYPQQAPQFVPMATGPVQMYVNTVPYSTYSTAPRPQAGYQQTFQMMPNQQIAYFPFVCAETQPQTTYFYNNHIALQHPGPPPSQVQSQSPNNTQSPQATFPINPTVTQQQSMPPKNDRRRTKAIPIKDPTAGKDKPNKMYEQDESHPASGESSARQTPQPPPPNLSKEMEAIFAKQVAQALTNDQQMNELEQLDHTGHNMYHQLTPPAMFSSSNMQHLVQSQRLQVPAKGFVPATPVVSALTDAVEVTLTYKLSKDGQSRLYMRRLPPQAKMPINPTITQQQSMPPKNNRRRAKVIPIRDPTTGKDKRNEMYEQDELHPASGESSARQTPQPPPPNPSKEMEAIFAKQVAQAITNDQQMNELEQLDHTGHNMYHQLTPPAMFSSSNMQHLVQSQRLQLPVKRFVPDTPVVSALTDAVEVTVTNKLIKDGQSRLQMRRLPPQAKMPINPTITQQHSMSPKNNQRRAKATPIMDTTTNKDKLNGSVMAWRTSNSVAQKQLGSCFTRQKKVEAESTFTTSDESWSTTSDQSWSTTSDESSSTESDEI